MAPIQTTSACSKGRRRQSLAAGEVDQQQTKWANKALDAEHQEVMAPVALPLTCAGLTSVIIV